MPYQPPGSVDSKRKDDNSSLNVDKPPEASRTPDIASKLFPKLRRKSSSNYQSALLSNKFETLDIAKVSPPAVNEDKKTGFPFKSDYKVTMDTHHALSPTLSPNADEENGSSTRWSLEGSKRTRQNGSIDLSQEMDDHDLNVDYEFCKPSPFGSETQQHHPAKLGRRGSSVYHSNQINSQSELNLSNTNIKKDSNISTSSGFEYDEFKRRMQYD